jgi:hypothetical protein
MVWVYVIPLVYVNVMWVGLALNVPYVCPSSTLHPSCCSLTLMSIIIIEYAEAGMTRGQLAGAVIGGLLVSFLIIGLIIWGMIYFEAFS